MAGLKQQAAKLDVVAANLDGFIEIVDRENLLGELSGVRASLASIRNEIMDAQARLEALEEEGVIFE